MDTNQSHPPADSTPSSLLQDLTVDVLAAVSVRLGVPVDDAGALLGLTAIGLTKYCWRNTFIEDWHSADGVGDADMMRANVATTRAVRDHLAAHGLDMAGLKALLTDRTRPVLPDGTTVRAFAGPVWDRLRRQMGRKVDQLGRMLGLLGDTRFVLLLSNDAARDCYDWWGGPCWPVAAERFVAALSDPTDPMWTNLQRERFLACRPPDGPDDAVLLRLLRDTPDQLDHDTAEWLTLGTALQAAAYRVAVAERPPAPSRPAPAVRLWFRRSDAGPDPARP